MNIRAKLITGITSLFAASIGMAAQAADYDDFAKVTGVSPQIEQINRPRQECHTEVVQVSRQVQTGQTTGGERATGGAVIGGIAGALLGNQVGRGNGRTAATAAGAIVGAISGDRLENNGNGNGRPVTETVVTDQPVQKCRMVDHWESRNTGYSVNYEYKGRNYTALLPYDPGTRLKVNVTVTPAQQ
jgi:uncharacterized protein YcfJ